MSSTNVLTDLDQRRAELSAELQACIQDNVMQRRRVDELARHKAELMQTLTRIRITCSEVNANVQDLEERKRSLEAIIEAENARVNAAREELTAAEATALEARKECKRSFETAVADVSQCYRVDCNKEHLKKEIFEANERIAALKRQALLVQASTLALVNQAQLDTELADTSSKMTAMGADSDETEELYLAHLQKKAEELQQQLDQIDKEIQSAEGTSASQTDVDQPPTTLDELLDAVTKFDPESATSRETFTLTKALAENLLQQLNPALEEMYKSIEDELRTIATSSGSPLNSIQLESILCTKARGEEECGTSILVSFAETCQQILERVETTSKMANRLLNAPLDEIQKQYDQITSTLSG